MPGLITHYIHGEAVLDYLPKSVLSAAVKHREAFNVGTQGPDVFFYYLPALCSRKLFGIGTKMHTGNFSLFLSGMANGIKDCRDTESRNIMRSYLFGYLCHYALDTETHPYIYYKTGSRKPGEINTLRYSAYHRSFETALDVLMLRLATGETPDSRRIWKLLRIDKCNRQTLAELMAKCINRAYGVPVTGKQVRRAFGYMTKITRLLQSKNGRRKRLMEFVEGVTVKDKIVSSLIHYGAGDDGIDYLNEGHGSWALPWDENNEKRHSFVEMFNRSIAEAVEIIACVSDFIDGKISETAMLGRVKNLSFSTGLDYNEKVEFKYADLVY